MFNIYIVHVILLLTSSHQFGAESFFLAEDL